MKKIIQIMTLKISFDVMSFLIEFLKFLKVRKKFWLLPIILVLAQPDLGTSI